MVKKEQLKRIVAGAIMVIHVTGRKSSYNVHLHILLPMGVIDDISGKWVSIAFIPYQLLHTLWKKYLLKMLEEFDSSSDMRVLLEKTDKDYPKGFVANLDKRILPKGGQGLAKYLAKYLFCPSISICRILNYSKANKTVDYVYNDHVTHKKQREKVDVLTFIGRMAQQIMPENFQRVRYFGLHSTKNAVKNKKKVVVGLQLAKGLTPHLKIEVNLVKAKQLTFREKILEWRKKDPLKCKKCGHQMELVQVWIKGKGYVFDLYEKMATGPPNIPIREEISTTEQLSEEFIGIQLDLRF